MSTREYSVLLWIIILIVYTKFKGGFTQGEGKNLLENLLEVVRLPVVKYALVVNVIYLLGMYLLFYRFGILISLWHIKDYILVISFTIIPSITLLYKSDVMYFSKKQLLDIFSFVFLWQFITGEYTFNFWIEFIFITPFMFLFSVMYVLSETKEEWHLVYKLFGFLLLVSNIGLIYFAIKKFLVQISDVQTMDFWLSFTLPLIILLLNIPIFIIAKYLFLDIEKPVIRVYGQYSLRGYIECFIYYSKQKKIYKSLIAQLRTKPKIKKVVEHNWDATGSRVRIQLKKKNISDLEIKSLIFDAILSKNKLNGLNRKESKFPAFVEIINMKKQTIAIWESKYSKIWSKKSGFGGDSGIEMKDTFSIGDEVYRVNYIKTYWDFQF